MQILRCWIYCHFLPLFLFEVIIITCKHMYVKFMILILYVSRKRFIMVRWCPSHKWRYTNFNNQLLKSLNRFHKHGNVFLKISKNSQENTCTRVSFNKVAGAEACNFTKRLWHRCFPVNFEKFLRTTFFKEYLRLLLL